MTNESAQTVSHYAWQNLTLSDSGAYVTALCTTKSNQLFAASWNPVASQGHLQRWSVTQQKWLPNTGKTFSNQINQMCCDTQGNIYLVGDTNAASNYVIHIYNSTGDKWTDADNGYKQPMNFICCDSQNNVYVTGNFQDANGHNIVMKYNLGGNSWTALTGSGFTQPLIDMCMGPNNTLVALSKDTDISLNFWNGQWSSVTAAELQDASGIGCDASGSVYFNAANTIWVCNITTKQFSNRQAPIQTFTGTIVFAGFCCIDGIVYYVTSGYTSTFTTATYVWVLENGFWKDITPPQINQNNDCVGFAVAGYTGKSHNILLASNKNYVSDGKELIH